MFNFEYLEMEKKGEGGISFLTCLYFLHLYLIYLLRKNGNNRDRNFLGFASAVFRFMEYGYLKIVYFLL